MKVYAIGDLHLSFKDYVIPGKWEEVEEYKSMEIFGENWHQHYKKIYDNWLKLVKSDDIVLIPGDISWATTIKEMEADIDFIKKLPGKKIFVKGNHDYWWQGITTLREALPDDFYLIQNDSLSFGKLAIAGSRGWSAPNTYQYDERDQKIFDRELIRLELSLKTIKEAEKIIVMMHYMPVNEQHQDNELIALLKKYNVDICIYGHLHDSESHQNRLKGENWGIDFKLVSSDFINFKPELILSDC